MKTSKLKERLIESRDDGRAQPRAGDAEGGLRAAPAARRVQARRRSRPNRSPHSSRRTASPACCGGSMPATAAPTRATDLNPAKPTTDGRRSLARGQSPAAARNARGRPRGLRMRADDGAAASTGSTRAFAARLVAVDTETSSARRDARRPRRRQPRARAQRCLLHPARPTAASDMFAEKPEQVAAADALAALKPLLESDAVLKVGQNVKYDHQRARAAHGIDVAPIDDTMVISFALDAGRGRRTASAAATGWTSWPSATSATPRLPFKDICGTGKKAIPFGEVPLDRATEYAAEDADVTWRLLPATSSRASPLEGGTRIYERVDRPLIPVVAAMERHGIKVDRAQLAAAVARNSPTEIAPARRRNPRARRARNSPSAAPSSWATSCSTSWATRAARKGKSGQYSTDQAMLEKLAGEGAPIARQGARMAPAGQAQIDLYRRAAGGDQSRNRPRPHQLFAGRRADRAAFLDRSQPAEHPDPHRDRARRSARPSWPSTGNVLLAADYSQIELRLAAHMADVPTLEGGLRRRRGHPRPHRAARCSARSTATPARGPRRSTSRSSTAFRAGGSPGRLGVEPDEAQAMIDTYFERFPGIQRYILADARDRARARLFGDAVRPQDLVPAHQFEEPGRTAGQRARGDQRADPGHQRRHHQARDGADDARARGGGPAATCGCCCRCTTNWCSNCPKATSQPPRR